MLRRVSLRTKLVATVVVLVIAAEAGFGVATTVLMRDHLLDELDRELTETVERLRVAGPLAFFNPGLPAVGQVDPPAACQPLPSDYLVYVRSPAQGFGVATYCEELYSDENLPPLPTDLEEALKVLSPAERLCVSMCYGAGLSHGEAADALNLPLGTVKSHVKRGLDKLRARLAPPGDARGASDGAVLEGRRSNG